MIGEIYLSSNHLASGSVLYTPVVYTSRGDPLGRPRSFMPTRSFMAATNKSRGNAPPPRSGQTLHVSQRVGATHRVALGHSCQHARSCPGQTNREAMPRPYAVRPNAPCVPTRRGDPPGRPRSFMPTRSFMSATNKSRGSASGWWAPRDEGEAVPRPHGPAKRSMCPNVGATHRVALGHSCQRARSWPGQSNREAWPRGGGRRGIRARQCLAPTGKVQGPADRLRRVTPRSPLR